MEYVNKVELVGKLARDVEVKDTKSSRVANIVVEVKDTYDGKEFTSEIEVAAWGKLVPYCEGQRARATIKVAGSLREDKWKGRDGVQRRRLKVKAERVIFE
jgi:single-stranded DNA-binding protein